MNVELFIKCSSSTKMYKPVVLDEITWETELTGSPSKLTFTFLNDNVISFSEGSNVILLVDKTPVFNGFVFEKQRDKNQRVQCICYDQIRYLKNTVTYTRKGGTTATGVIRELAKDYALGFGDLVETGIGLPARIDKDKTILDIILFALKETSCLTDHKYVLYDNFGMLTLKREADWYVDYLICKEVAENYDYSSSIDKDTYNEVQLYQEIKDETTKETVRDVKAIDAGQKYKDLWGRLVLYQKVPDGLNPTEEAKLKLVEKCRATRTLNIQNALGDVRVRAGCHIDTNLRLGDTTTKYKLRCDSVTHRFTSSSHFMDMTLSGHDGMFGEDN